jgi:hypothetical protein
MALESTASIFGISLYAADHSDAFVFEYLHSLARPILRPQPSMAGSTPLSVVGDCVLSFGMLEGNAVVTATRCVYDPQSPRFPRSFASNGSVARDLAIVCNQSEAQILSGSEDIIEAGRKLLSNCGVVVVKCGARGCLVMKENGMVEVPAFRAAPESLIGSGDLFTAMFAYQWLLVGLDPEAAATSASQATAQYCATRVLPTQWPIAVEYAQAVTTKRGTRSIYLAGPFFSPEQLWMIEETRHHLEQQGLSVFSPYHDVGLGPPKRGCSP